MNFRLDRRVRGRRLPALLTGLVLAGSTGAAKADPVFVVANPYAAGLDNSQIAVGTLTIFGDSYSMAKRKAFHNWAEQLNLDEAVVASLADIAKSGATARNSGTNTFAKQTKKWLATSPSFASTDLMAVYLGYNDIDGGTDPDGSDLGKPEADYKSALKTVIGKGANAGGRRIFLIMPHNWGRSPYYVAKGGTAVMQQRTQIWDAFVAKTAQSFSSSYGNLVAVDLYAPLERVFANPGAFCFTNVTTADHAHSATTALYDDDFHFGRHGQNLIEQVVEYYLTRGWDSANTYKKQSTAQARLSQDLDDGKVFTQPCPAGAQHRIAPSATARTPAEVDREAGFGLAWERHLRDHGGNR